MSTPDTQISSIKLGDNGFLKAMFLSFTDAGTSGALPSQVLAAIEEAIRRKYIDFDGFAKAIGNAAEIGVLMRAFEEVSGVFSQDTNEYHRNMSFWKWLQNASGQNLVQADLLPSPGH